jgi:uncharacterized protein YdaU (DUF1376 family)
MKPDTYMPIVIGDYLKDTMHLACSEHGAYLLLLFHYWTSGPLPDDDRKLAAIARCERAAWPEIREVLAPFFAIADGVWTHKRVEQELLRARAKQAANAERAKGAAHARWNAPSIAPSIAISIPQAMLEQCPPSASPLLEINPDRGSSTMPVSRKKIARTPATTIDGFEIGREEVQYAYAMGMNPTEVERTGTRFRAYWATGKGQGTRRTAKGWRSTWQNWIAKDIENLKGQGNGSGTAKRENGWVAAIAAERAGPEPDAG